MERTLVINWHGTSKRHKILLCFAHPCEDGAELGVERNYIVWKLINAKQGSGSASVYYSGRIGCGHTKLCPENHVRGSNWIEVQRSESVDLSTKPDKEKSGHGIWNKATVRNIDDPFTHIHNGTEVPQTFVLGTIRPIGFHRIQLFEPTFCWKDVRPGQAVSARFDSTLCAIIVDDKEYHESEMITTALAPERVFWRQNIHKLSDVTYLEFTETDEGFVMRPSA